MSKNENNAGVCFAAAEPVLYDIRNKETGKTERVTSCRVCVVSYDAVGVRGMEVIKSTPEFADFASKNIGARFDGKAVACDTRGRACTLYDA